MQLVFISLAGDHLIKVLELYADGGLHDRLEVPMTGGPGPLAFSPDKSVLHVGIRSTNEMASFRVHDSGELTEISRIDLESDPCFISIDKTGNFLLSAYYEAGHVAVHNIGSSGGVEAPAIEWRATAHRAHCALTDATNSHVFVPHVDDSNVIFQFKFDENDGTLTPNNPATVRPPDGYGPRHYRYHPSGQYVYFDNEQGSSVTGYYLNSNGGTLAPFQTVSTLPEGFTGDNSCAQIHMSVDGRFLYASNRGHHSIAIFEIDEETGELTSRGQQAAPATPRAFGIDTTQRFMLAGGLDEGVLETYARDSKSGLLTSIGTRAIGDQPMYFLFKTS